MKPQVASALYFRVQKHRGGVSREMIQRASEVLESSGPELDRYLLARLEAVHGPAASQPDWLQAQSLVERSQLRPAFDELLQSGPPDRVEHRRTSGSTATPYSFVKDKEMTGWMDAAMWAVYRWHGIEPGDRQARFWGVPLNAGKRYRRAVMDRALNRRRLSAFAINPDRSVRFFHEMRRFKPSHAYGYPNLLNEFAEHCQAAGLDGTALGLRAVICTGEMLAPPVRLRLADFFGCRIVNEYGCTESGIVAFECEFGTSHQIPVAVLPEVVGPSGAPAAHDEPGEVVVTDLFGSILPLLRYRLQDVASGGSPSDCGCGRALQVLQVTQGRVYHLIRRPGQDPIYANVLGYTVPEGVLRFRGEQVAPDHLQVQVVPRPSTDPHMLAEECRMIWSRALGPSIRVSVSPVRPEDIPYPSSGKLQYFVPLGNRNGTGVLPAQEVIDPS
jgi:phenylacetate-CoA ligase